MTARVDGQRPISKLQYFSSCGEKDVHLYKAPKEFNICK